MLSCTAEGQMTTSDAGALAPEKAHFETILMKTGWCKMKSSMLNLGRKLWSRERLFVGI